MIYHLPFLLLLQEGDHDPKFLLNYFANRLDCAPEALIEPAIPDPKKDLLNSSEIEGFLILLQEAVDALNNGDSSQAIRISQPRSNYPLK